MVAGKAKKVISNATLTNCGPRDLPSRTISFNANGSHLAIGTSSSAIHIWDPSKNEPKEVSVLSGHSAPVTRVRYHPVDLGSLLSASNNDATVRLWDARSSPRSNSVGKIATRTRPLTVEWNPVQLHAFLVLEKNGDAKVYDKRKLSPTSKESVVPPLHSMSLDKTLPESCLFDPTGEFLVAGASPTDGVAPLQIWNWRNEGETKIHSFPAHTGMILSMAFSHDGRTLITGGHDAMVGIWNVESMCCTHAVSKHARYVLSTSFAPDDTMFATSTYDECFVTDASKGTVIGAIPFSKRPRSGGAEEIAFHPVSPHVIACAKSELKPPSAVTLVKLAIS